MRGKNKAVNVNRHPFFYGTLKDIQRSLAPHLFQ